MLAYSNIFIVGSPRSGKTTLQRLIGFHSKLAWFSQYNKKFPYFPRVGLINKIYTLPFFHFFFLTIRNFGLLPSPWEMRKDYVDILSRNGSLDAKDVRVDDKKKLKRIFQDQLKIQGKKILITDYGRPARLLYFDEIFPNSKFIHVIRDGRSVVADFLLNRSKWFPKERRLSFFYKKVPPKFEKVLKNSGSNYRLTLAALRWKMAIDEIEKQRIKLKKEQCLLIKYEDLVSRRFEIVDQCLRFLNLDWTKPLQFVVKNSKLYKNKAWKKYFNQGEKKLLANLLKEELLIYGYL